MSQLDISISYDWQPVFVREKVEYFFPMALSPFMRTKYKRPAIFRWDVHQKVTGDKKMVYIGEAQELSPKRLYAYLNPGPTQIANRKVNTDFRGYLKEKLSIKLDICEVQQLTLNGEVLGPGALNDKYVRRVVAGAMIMEHQKKGFTIMEL